MSRTPETVDPGTTSERSLSDAKQRICSEDGNRWEQGFWYSRPVVNKIYGANNLDLKTQDSRIARLRLQREILLDHHLGNGFSTTPDKLKRKLVLSPRGQKGFLRVSRKWMIRLGGKFENVLVSQVKVLKQALWTSTVHDLMPVILDPDRYDLWLDPGMTDAQVVSELLKPYDARQMRCYPISNRINHVANDDEECCRPVESMPAQNQLFS